MGILSEVLVEAYRVGYRIDSQGLLLNPDGNTIKGNVDKNGYRHTSRKYAKNIVQKLYFHRLQAYQLYGDKLFDPEMVVRHLNGDKLDNRPGNIAIGTQKQNMLDRPIEDRLAHALKGSAAQKKLTAEQVKQLRADRCSGMKYAELMSKYGIGKSTVSYIVNRKTYATIAP